MDLYEISVSKEVKDHLKKIFETDDRKMRHLSNTYAGIYLERLFWYLEHKLASGEGEVLRKELNSVLVEAENRIQYSIDMDQSDRDQRLRDD